MAFQIDPSIPLQAQRTTFDPASILMQAQQNGLALEKHRFEMQKLREDYDLAKEQRKQQKAMQMGIASELQKIQQGTPAQYRTTFPQTMPTGQMPQGMTGVLASERGQNMPSPDLFGENILKGNFDVRREMIAPEVKGVTPDYLDVLNVSAKNALQVGDIDSFIKFSNAIQQERAAKDIEWGTNPTKGINPQTGLPDAYITNRKGDVKWLGSGVYEAPKDPKAPITWKVGKGRTEETWGYDAKGNQVLLGVQNLDAPRIEKPDPVTQALTIAEGKEKIKQESEQRAKVAEKYADAESIEPILKQLISQLEKVPKTGIGRDIQGGLEYFGAGNEAAQNAMAEVKNTEALLVPFAQKQTGPQSDKDVQQYKEQVAAASNTLASTSSRIAAAKNALMFAERVKKRYGNYASDILSGKVTPDELKTEQSKPTRSKDELFRLYKEFKADYEAEKDPAMRKIMIDAARADGLIK
jgi:hypothetical protein